MGHRRDDCVEPGEDSDFMHDRIDAYLAEPKGCTGLITGLINLSGLLLSGMEMTTGKEPRESASDRIDGVAARVAALARSA